MSAQLDARQRAMLAEMGIRVWAPPAASPDGAIGEQTPSEPAPARRSERAAVATGEHPPAQAAAAAPQRASAPAPAAAPSGPVARAPRPAGIEHMDWPALQAAVAGCRACGLCAGRTQTVFGVGSRSAQWMVVGEAPGENEDRQGEPFVGQAGKLLDQMLAAIGLSRHAGSATEFGATNIDPASAQTLKQPANGVYIANVLKCRPPGNRNPQPDEVVECEPYLRRQVELLKPRIILAMGRFAVQSLLHTGDPIGRLRGRVHRYQGVPVVVTYHPAYLLRALAEKAKAWDDLCLALEVFREQGGAASA